MPNFSILEGDCRISLQSIKDETVHCAVCSPPYFNLRDYGLPPLCWDPVEPSSWDNSEWIGSLGEEDNPNHYIAHLIEIFASVKRVLRSDGTLWVNISDSYAKKDYPNLSVKKKDLFMVPSLFAIAMRSEGWHLRSDCIWHISDKMPETPEDRCPRDFEHVFMFSKTENYYFDREAIRVETGGQSHYQRTVWKIAASNYKGAHVATFPEKLAAMAIKAGTSEKGVCRICGTPQKRITERERIATRPAKNNKVDETGLANRDPERHITKIKTIGWINMCLCEPKITIPATVLDPFSGSGTTGVAALNLGRNYIGCELSPEYAEVSKERLGKICSIFG